MGGIQHSSCCIFHCHSITKHVIWSRTSSTMPILWFRLNVGDVWWMTQRMTNADSLNCGTDCRDFSFTEILAPPQTGICWSPGTFFVCSNSITINQTPPNKMCAVIFPINCSFSYEVVGLLLLCISRDCSCVKNWEVYFFKESKCLD